MAKTQFRRWTHAAIDCYKRGCVCQGCYFSDFFSDEKQSCRMKSAVIELVRLFGKPKGVREKTIIQEEQ